MWSGWPRSLRRRSSPHGQSSTGVRQTRWWSPRLRSLEVGGGGVVERVVDDPGRPTTCWPFIP